MFPEYFPIWSQLTAEEQELLLQSAQLRSVPAGTLLHGDRQECEGLFLVRSGQLRSFILSDEGKEITIYRLFPRDLCLFSASCLLSSIQFEVMVEAEKDTEFWLIPPQVYQRLMTHSALVANFTNQLMASHFSEVMWLVEQVLWKSFDRRLAAFLLSESTLEGSDTLKITHERIAAHLGSAREVVTRMLRYFQSEGMVTLRRGQIQLLDTERLQALSDS